VLRLELAEVLLYTAGAVVLRLELAEVLLYTAGAVVLRLAGWLVNLGAPLKVVANLLGHSSTRMVDLVYGARRGRDPEGLGLEARDAQQAARRRAERRRAVGQYGTNVPETPGADGAPDASAAMLGAAETAASPTKKPMNVVPRVGIEPTTRGFSGRTRGHASMRIRVIYPRTRPRR
jgi:hypothetical protein